MRIAGGLAAAALASFATACDPPADDPDPQVPECCVEGDCLRILTLGNSITQGDDQRQSYRYPLWKGLIDLDWCFDLVGSQRDNHDGNPEWPDYLGEQFDQDHEGHWGWRANQISDSLAGWLGEYDVDAALVHIGTNDLRADDEDPEITAGEVALIVDELRDANPEVTIFLAQIIPTASPEDIGPIEEYNGLLADLAVEMDEEGSQIILVDQYEGYDPAEYSHDGLHPNEVGEIVMAARWLEALEGFFGPTG